MVTEQQTLVYLEALVPEVAKRHTEKIEEYSKLKLIPFRDGHHATGALDVEGALYGPPKGVAPRFDAIAKLEAGWFRGEGSAFRGDWLDQIRILITRSIFEHEAPVPYIYPDEDQCIEAEWRAGEWEVSATFEEGKSIYLHAACVSEARKGTFEEREIHASIDTAPALIAEFVRRFSTEGQ